MAEPVTEWIGTAEAARRLGVKQATLYSYVSRGVLRRRTGEDGRASLFDAGGGRGAGPPRAGPGSRAPGSSSSSPALTEITSDRAFYRGLDITALAAGYELEDVSWLLWTGELTGREPGRGALRRPRCGRAGPRRRHCRRGPCRWSGFG